MSASIALMHGHPFSVEQCLDHPAHRRLGDGGKRLQLSRRHGVDRQGVALWHAEPGELA